MELGFKNKRDVVDAQQIERACQALSRGELVAFPTETVYGLGADATNPQALKRLYAVKGRPESHPVIVHLAHINELTKWAKKVPPAAYRLAESFWPGPLTLILPKADIVLDLITGGQTTVGVRIPHHPVAQALLSAYGTGIAAPSANRFGRLSPTTSCHVALELGSDVAMVLDGGPCQVGIESTIVDLTGETPVILRPGMILPRQIMGALGCKEYEHLVQGQQKRTKIRTPGSLPSHYAPKTPLRVVQSDYLLDFVGHLVADKVKFVVLAFQEPPGVALNVPWVTVACEPESYARDLYQNLRCLDSQLAEVIIVESIPENEAWFGIADRIRRASSKVTESFEEDRNDR